jgi:tellurite resistance protein
MSVHTVSNLYIEYTEHRRIKLTFEQFSVFITFYPALLVAHTDGVIDENEWQLLKGLADNLAVLTVRKGADKEELKDLKQLFFSEFAYLIKHFDLWERKFIKALKNYLVDQPKESEAVIKVIYSLADASNGICDKEKVMIEHLQHELGLEKVNI